MNSGIKQIAKLIEKLHKEKYPEAKVIFLAGSVMRGEGTSTSDLDLVVVYSKLPNAFRDSYQYGGWPIEAFMHNPETLKYFFSEFDTPSGYPSLASMVSEGIEIPSASTFSIVSLASDLLANHGGFLFEGYRVDAPAKWRKT